MPLSHPIFRRIARLAREQGVDAYVVGGYVRDHYLRRPSTDIDVVVVGSGIAVAEALAAELHTRVSVFKTFGTAMLRAGGAEIEFVGARRESYSADSRKPAVEEGTLEDDQRRRDFTVNALAWSLNGDTFGELVDPFEGMYDLEDCIIRTPCDPDVTFSDDPLRMMRAVRFATQLGFDIYPETLDAITRNASRIGIISRERIADELNKIMASPVPSTGWLLLRQTGLLPLIFPQLAAMEGISRVNGRGHKDNFFHTLAVLDNVAKASGNLWLRWAALLHDIGKPATKHWDEKLGWTFHNHDFVGSKMIPDIFRHLKLPLNDKMKYVRTLVGLHMRPIALVEDEVTDSAVRRLSNYAQEYRDDLMILARADITSRNEEKRARFLANFAIVEEKFKAVEAKDFERNRKPLVRGDEIMHIFNLPQSPAVGKFISALLEAQREDQIPDRDSALQFVYRMGKEMGIEPVNPPFDMPSLSQETTE